MLSLQKNYDALVYAFFLFFFFLKGTAKGACAHVSSTRCTHVNRDQPQPRIEPVSQDPSSARGTALGQVAAEEFCLYAPRCFFYLKKCAGCSLGRTYLFIQLAKY